MFLIVWTFLRRTIFSLKWWKKHWYIPWLLLVSGFVWVFTAGRTSIVSFIKKSQEIREEERTKIEEIETKNKEDVLKLEEAAKEEKDKISESTKAKIEVEKKKIKKQQDLIRGNSEAINKDLNDVIRD